jgi:hypothetical protein
MAEPIQGPIAAFTEYLSSLTPSAFEEFVADLLRESGDFERVELGHVVDGLQIDIVAHVKKQFTGLDAPIYVEVKRVPLASLSLVQDAYGRFAGATFGSPGSRFVLAVSGRLSAAARAFAEQRGLTVWDAQALHSRLTEPVRRRWLIAGTPTDVQEKASSRKTAALIETHASIVPGDADALKYQRWVADVLEHVFVPPLGPIHYEDSDVAKRNRRDVILENWAPDGFWSQLRASYAADQVVVDAKNYSSPIGKRSVIELSHYLKPYGCGLFGIIFSRMGASVSGRHAQREEWIGAKKMILVLDDSVALELLRLKSEGARAEEVLRTRIANFRKGL